MKVIVGLGNPGISYKGTRHNVGFEVVDNFARENGVKFAKRKFSSILVETTIQGEKVLLIKPQTYMNLSGRAVARVVDFFNIDLSDLLVIYDDIDLELGTLRLRCKGSGGTHNGMNSVIETLATQNFPRLRIGISGESSKRRLKNYVLGKFNKKEKLVVKEVIARASDAVESFVLEGINSAMNKFNQDR